ncbi:hypothetical protein LJ737_26520 [Hymenobacter sp. 15J16-1T3B]|uniref:hypothetical protein n=1 Tax=Hymenobacter sp. 15J16-1T3B TaxID=2886941 RepID=UPI001D0FBFE7|nr:hypothetical protein [Hymenobacter sp. 15J16-1T3B]MCC3160820.1 hypothetical protein [Hymenobacter sp. 15J16-1T3B]
MPKRFPLSILILFVLLDLGYTFWQNYQLPLEGDLPQIVLPAPDCRQVLGDPFGWAALTRHEVYVAPNRFFAHAAMVGYFKSVPFGLQKLGLSPVNSIYAACALFNTLVQALIMYVLGRYASGTWRLSSRKLWVTMALLVPLFQVGGYHNQMGIADNSITYTFFYAFPLLLLLLYFLPFYQAEVDGRPFRVGPLTWLGLLGLMVVLSFNGAIVPGVVAVLSVGIGLRWLVQQGPLLRQGRVAEVWRRIPWQPFGLLLIFGLLCLYSLYIGTFEAEQLTHDLPLWERYQRLPLGLNDQFRRPGLPIFLGAVLLNLALIRWRTPATDAGRRLLRAGRWLGLFALVFILLLPLGGYRNYRPLILRRDSVLPILLALMALYILTSYYLLRHLPAAQRRAYLAWVLVLSAFYTVSDHPWLVRTNACERQAFRTLAESAGPVVRLPNDCTVMAWDLATYPEASETPAQLLDYWGVTWGKRLYVQEPKP